MTSKTARKRWKIALLSFSVLLIIGLVAARLYLPYWVKDYVNAQINSLKGYEGGVEDIDINLYRGAYTIHEMVIKKTGSGMPVPFVRMTAMDISVHWGALFHGRVVAKIATNQPVINFAVNRTGTDAQTGSNVDWSEEIKKLVPIDINRLSITNGKIAYRNFSTKPQVDIFINDIDGEVTNLRNVDDKDNKLPSKIIINGKSIGGGNLALQGNMNILRAVPDMDIALKLEHVDLPALNNYFRAFAAIDVEKGNFALYSEVKINNGAISGYVKPIATDIHILDGRHTNPIRLAWEALAAFVIEIFTNQSKDQFATEIPLSGHIDNVQTSTWSAVVGVIHNAFVHALDRGVDSKRVLPDTEH